MLLDFSVGRETAKSITKFFGKKNNLKNFLLLHHRLILFFTVNFIIKLME